jgi:hypothetical protein
VGASLVSIGTDLLHRKDKTLVEILDRLKSLEGDIKSLDGKVDNLTVRGAMPPSIYGSTQANQALGPSPTVAEPSSESTSWPSSNIHLSATTSSTPATHIHYAYVSAAYKMLSWPFVEHLLETSPHKPSRINLAPLQRDGAAIMLGQAVSADNSSMMVSRHGRSSLDVSISGLSEDLGNSTLALSWDSMRRLAKAYFETFNLLYPIIDRNLFQTQILPSIASNGFDEGMNSTLACLVLALGEVAIAGVQGEPLTTYTGRPGGIRGGTLTSPPGLMFFNEARKRMGFNLTECSLENVQIFALAA